MVLFNSEWQGNMQVVGVLKSQKTFHLALQSILCPTPLMLAMEMFSNISLKSERRTKQLKTQWTFICQLKINMTPELH